VNSSLEMDWDEDGTYLGEWGPREEAAGNPVELVLPESEHEIRHKMR